MSSTTILLLLSLESLWESSVWIKFCVIIGFLVFTQKTLTIIKFAWFMFMRPPKKLTSYGSWALITGCTDGIGKAITFEIAATGLNLILVGRNIHKLQTTSNEIWEKYGKDRVRIKVVVIDFSRITGEEIEGKIKDEIEGLDVGVLVNNVGLATHNFKCFHEVDFEGVDEMLNVNMGSLTWVTRAVIPSMIKKGKGVVVNIGSASTVVVTSYPLALYGATKAYISMLSRSLSVEYEPYGIDIQCQMPMFVATKMVPKEMPTLFSASTEQFARASRRWIGHREFMIVPLWSQALQVYLISTLPDFITNFVGFGYYLHMRNSTRKPT